MFDYELNPFLIEINTNPGLEISSPLIQKLVPRMIDDAFRLTIDEYFETEFSKDRFDKNGKYISPFPVEGYNNNENLFELIGTMEKWFKVNKNAYIIIDMIIDNLYFIFHLLELNA